MKWTFKPLREIWLNIGLEKIDTYEEVLVKALLNSGAMGLFMSKRLAEKEDFKLEKLKRPLWVRNVDNSMLWLNTSKMRLPPILSIRSVINGNR